MIIVRNSIIPFKGFKALNFLGLILFVRKNAILTKYNLNHEEIHSKQYKETLWIGFLLLYLIHYIINVIIYLDFHTAYRNVCFEKESYFNEYDLSYLDNRPCFNWLKYF